MGQEVLFEHEDHCAYCLPMCSTVFSIFPSLIIFAYFICSDPSLQSSPEFLRYNHAPHNVLWFLSEYLPRFVIAYLFVITCGYLMNVHFLL